MKWTDIEEIAINLEEKYPEEDILSLRFTTLQAMILSLPQFNDDQNKCNEKILEAILMEWLNERKNK